MLHANLCIPVKTSDAFDQVIDSGLGVWNVTGRHQDNVARPADGDGTLTFGNINTNSVHKRYSFTKK